MDELFEGFKEIPKPNYIDKTDYKFVRAGLESSGVIFDSGLTAKEFKLIEKEYNFCFPPDLREFLSKGLPVSAGWINWGRNNKNKILEMLNYPYDGLCFDVEYGNLWQKSWGEKPKEIKDRLNKLKELVAKAPKLIPIWNHNYIPNLPQEEGNPVLSVCQSDIIYSAINLENSLYRNFHLEHNMPTNEPNKRINFWTDIVENYETN